MSGVTKTCVVKFIRQGVGVSLTDVEYADSTSSTVAPTTGWQTNAPAWQVGHYIWSRTKTVYTDGTYRYSDPICITNGKSIASIVEQYYKSTSSTSLVGGSWQDNKAPTWEAGKYIWTRSKITYTDGSVEYTDAINTTGQKGDKGDKGDQGQKGDKGDKGDAGTNGTGFKKINTTARSYTLAYWHKCGDPGHNAPWGISGYDNSHISVGDTVYIAGKVTNCYDSEGNQVDVMSFGTCVSISSATITMYTTNLIIGGTKGDVGSRGPALRGPQDWSSLSSSYNFYQGAEGETYKDVVVYSGNYYVCMQSHKKSSRTKTPDQDGDVWTKADKMEMVATQILLASYALIENLGASAIEMKNSTGQTVFYAKDGTISCKVGTFENITLSGTIKAEGATIGGFEVKKYGSVYYTQSNVFSYKKTLPSSNNTYYYMNSTDAYVEPRSENATIFLPQYPVGGSFVVIHNTKSSAVTVRSRTGNFVGESISYFDLAAGHIFVGFFGGDNGAGASRPCVRIKY